MILDSVLKNIAKMFKKHAKKIEDVFKLLISVTKNATQQRTAGMTA